MKISDNANDARVWGIFWIASKESLYQYELLINKLNSYEVTVEQLIKVGQEKKVEIESHYQDKLKQFKESIQKVQNAVASLKYTKSQEMQQEIQKLKQQ